LIVVAFSLANCRYGYQELDSPGMAGSTTGGLAGASSGGDMPSAGTVHATGGEAQVSGSGGTTGGQASGTGGQPAGTAGAGEAGAGGEVGCTSTLDCNCATLSGHDYWFCRNALTWLDAEAYCETQSMHLVSIDTQAENDFLGSTGATFSVFALNGFAFIGASDRAVAGEWRWVDGTLFWQGGPAGVAVADRFSQWAASSPSDSGIQQCAGLLDTGEWQVRSCTAVVPFICESP
jgi:hypothetical protein